jgi:hypothetical protein
MFIIELTLTKSEMAVVLDSLGQSSLIGMPANAFKFEPETRTAVAKSGVDGLVDKELAERRADGSLAIDADLRAIVQVAADANLACVIVKDIPGSGKQVFVHGALNNAVVEHTRPSETSHRLAVLESQASLPLRWAKIIPTNDHLSEDSLECELSVFEKAVKLANSNSLDEAADLFRPHASHSLVRRLVKDMNTPLYSANIAMIWRENHAIMHARNPMVLVGRSGAWLINQKMPGKPEITIKAANRQMVMTHLVEQWKAVSRSSV